MLSSLWADARPFFELWRSFNYQCHQWFYDFPSKRHTSGWYLPLLRQSEDEFQIEVQQSNVISTFNWGLSRHGFVDARPICSRKLLTFLFFWLLKKSQVIPCPDEEQVSLGGYRVKTLSFILLLVRLAPMIVQLALGSAKSCIINLYLSSFMCMWTSHTKPVHYRFQRLLASFAFRSSWTLFKACNTLRWSQKSRLWYTISMTYLQISESQTWKKSNTPHGTVS